MYERQEQVAYNPALGLSGENHRQGRLKSNLKTVRNLKSSHKTVGILMSNLQDSEFHKKDTKRRAFNVEPTRQCISQETHKE